MTEETTNKRGRLAAAVIASSTLAFSSFAIGAPAALADEDEDLPVAAATQEVDTEPTDEVANDTPANGDGEDVEPVEEKDAESGDEAASPEQPEATAEPSQEPDSEETPGDGDGGEGEAVLPAIDLDVHEGTPGSTVNISGENFSPNLPVELRLRSESGDNVTALSTGDANENGEITFTVTIPDDTDLGEYYIEAFDEAADASSSVSYSVVEEEPGEDEDDEYQVDPALYINPGSGPAGSVIALNGSGFTANGDVEVFAAPTDGGDAVVSETIAADEGGSINGNELMIPEDAANGLYEITAVDVQTSEAAESVTFNVTDVTLTVTPETISEEDFRDSGVTLTVENLEEGETVNLDFGTAYSPIPSLAGTATADETGTAVYTVQETEDNVYVGNYSVNVSHSESGVTVATGNFEVTSELPQVTATPQEPTDDGAVFQGGMLNVSAYNVTPENTVTVDFGIEGVEEQQFETESNGGFVTEFEVPQDTAPGVKELTVTDDQTGAVGTTQYTVAEADGEVTEPALTADRDQILLEDFVGNADDEPGVHFTVEGLEAYTDITYTVVSPGSVDGLDRDTSTNDEGVANFFIYGYDYVSDPSVYLGDYSVTVTYEDEAGETQELGPVTFSVVEELIEGPRIVLESDEVYQGGVLEVDVSNLTPGGEVTFDWNPTETMTADENGYLEAELPIADDAETGAQQLTVTNEATNESNSVGYTVLEAGVTEPGLTIDPETITLDEFIGDPEDGAGVAHVVQGMQPNSEISYVVSGPEGVNNYEQTATVDEDGIVDFVIHGYDVANPAVYLGEYTTVVTYEDEDGEIAELSGNFTVVSDEDGAPGAGDGDDDAAAPAGGTSADLNGTTGLAQTGATVAQLGLLAGVLLLAGGAFVAFANRARLFSRKA